MTSANKPTVVIDTNLLISALIRKGNHSPAQLVTAWRNHYFHLAMTSELISEVEMVLKREKISQKYALTPEEIEDFIAELRFSAQFVTPEKGEALPLHSRDQKDDILLACALGGDCDYLITGDEDLLILNGRPELGKLKIIKAADLLRRNT
jgi:putative PIN family toxin of toxin-antitoxin system